MKRHLLTQMRNEWRSNIWIIIELVVVSCVLWFIFLYICMILHIKFDRKGYDTEDIVVAGIKYIGQNSPAFTPYTSENSGHYNDLQLLMANLRSNPYVEVAGYGSNALPYQFNYSGNRLTYVYPDTAYNYDANFRKISPEIIKVLRIEGRDGQTPDQLAAVIEREEMVLGTAEMRWEGLADEKLFLGREVFIGDTSNVIKIGALAYGIRRSDYEPLWNGVAYVPIKGMPNDLMVRVKSGKTREFIASLTPEQKQVGNVYFGGIRSLNQMKDEVHLGPNTSIRDFLVCAVFLFVIIFLGFLGTFWFKVQQRVGEIAVRKVTGATSTDIFRRLVSEGLILLVFAMVISIALEVLLTHYDVVSLESIFGNDGGSSRYESMGITFILLLVMIVAGIWFPARSAMRINPAVALKDL